MVDNLAALGEEETTEVLNVSQHWKIMMSLTFKMMMMMVVTLPMLSITMTALMKVAMAMDNGSGWRSCG